MKIILTVGIMAGLSAVSVKAQEGGCDGPVFVGGYTAGTCNCVPSTPGNGSGGGTGSCQPSSLTIGYRSDYYTCGGIGYKWCTSDNENVGWVNPGCVDTPNFPALTSQILAAADCERLNNGYPPLNCTFSWCTWNTCTMATSGGTPITAMVYTGLGGYNGCWINGGL